MTDDFHPPFYLASAVTQTLLASRNFPGQGNNPMVQSAREVILNPLADVRLQGFYSPQLDGHEKGLVMLLHGWEGSAASAYVLRTGRFLYERGFSIFRLNYRDHGATHHLNPGLFYAVLLDEVFEAVRQVAAYESELPFHLMGFSLGGNFALRVARKCKEDSIRNLRDVVAVSPVLDPSKSTQAIDANLLLRNYFRDKWSRSLKRKQACYPNRYDFTDVLKLKTLAEMTEVLIRRYSEYESASDYFHHYAVLKDALAELTVPVTVVTAQDDPIIPVADFYDLKLPASIELVVHRNGGHNGFIETLSGRTWYERKVMEDWAKAS